MYTEKKKSAEHTQFCYKPWKSWNCISASVIEKSAADSLDGDGVVLTLQDTLSFALLLRELCPTRARAVPHSLSSETLDMLSYIGNTQRYNLPYHIFVRPR